MATFYLTGIITTDDPPWQTLSQSLPKRRRRREIIEWLNDNEIGYIVHFAESKGVNALGDWSYQFRIEVQDDAGVVFTRMMFPNLRWHAL